MTDWAKKLFFLMTAVLAWHPALAKKPEPVATPPPFAKAGSAKAYLHEPVEVALSVGGRVVEPMTFLIRKLPQSGVLSNLRRTGRNTAVVTYTPNANAVPTDDCFAFAAQSSDSPVSAPASIWVRLLDRPPVLEHSASLDFGTVYLGDSAARELVLSNSGGGQAVGEVRPNPPWSVAGNASFTVPSGREVRIRVIFTPGEERYFSDRVRLGGGPNASVELNGVGEAPLSWPKEGLVFSPEHRAKGFVELALSNHSREERTLTLDWPDLVKAPREVAIPSGGTVNVRAEIVGPIKSRFQGAVKFRFGQFSGTLPLTIFQKPANFVITPESGLDLGETQKGKELRGKFSVTNTGEADSGIKFSMPDGMRVVPDPANLILRGGEQRGFDVQFASSKPGPVSDAIVVSLPSGPSVRLAVKASVRENHSLPVAKLLNIPDRAPAVLPEVPSGKVPPVLVTTVLESKPHEVEIGWDLTSPETSGYLIQRRQISSPKEGQVFVQWLPWQDVKIHIANGKATARWERMPENAFWTIRIVGLDAEGNPGTPSPPFQISTPVSDRFAMPLWAWLFIFSAAAAGIAGYVVRCRKARLAHEDERLARLEAG